MPMKLVRAGLLRNALYVVSKLATSNYMYLVWKFSQVPNITGRVICLTVAIIVPDTIPWKGAVPT
jgi:hypothetical protein